MWPFQLRTSCAGCDARCRRQQTSVVLVSIHAPRAGCDAIRPGSSPAITRSFNPRTPRGATPIASGVAPGFGLPCLQSTHSRGVRRVREVVFTDPLSRCFNPRTPRGVRHRYRAHPARWVWFQSTHPARGARGCVVGTRASARVGSFDPRTPRGMRQAGVPGLRERRSPNPRTPRGVRRPSRSCTARLRCFNPRTLRGVRSSLRRRIFMPRLSGFNPRTPRGGATSSRPHSCT